MAYIKTLFKKFFNGIEEGEDNSQVYPVTVTKAVFDQDNNSLEQLLQNLDEKINTVSSKVGITRNLYWQETIDFQVFADNCNETIVSFDRSKSRLTITFRGINSDGAFIWNWFHTMKHIEYRKLKLNTLVVGNKQYDFNCETFKWEDTVSITIPSLLTGYDQDITGIGHFSGPGIVKPSQNLEITLTVAPQQS